MMAATDWAGISLVVTAVFGGVVALIKIFQDLKELRLEQKRRDDETDTRVDRVWDANVRRGEIESNRKLKEPRLDGPPSPDRATAEIVFKVEVRKAYLPIAQILRKMRRDNPLITRSRFAELLEQTHGEWMHRHICEVLGIDSYACHAAAWELSEEGRETGWDSDKKVKAS